VSDMPHKKGITGMLTALFKKQPIENNTHPTSQHFKRTKQQFMEQQDDFRIVINDVINRLEKKKGKDDVIRG